MNSIKSILVGLAILLSMTSANAYDGGRKTGYYCHCEREYEGTYALIENSYHSSYGWRSAGVKVRMNFLSYENCYETWKKMRQTTLECEFMRR